MESNFYKKRRHSLRLAEGNNGFQTQIEKALKAKLDENTVIEYNVNKKVKSDIVKKTRAMVTKIEKDLMFILKYQSRKVILLLLLCLGIISMNAQIVNNKDSCRCKFGFYYTEIGFVDKPCILPDTIIKKTNIGDYNIVIYDCFGKATLKYFDTLKIIRVRGNYVGSNNLVKQIFTIIDPANLTQREDSDYYYFPYKNGIWEYDSLNEQPD